MKNTPKTLKFSAGNNVNKLGSRGGQTTGKVNFPAGLKMSFAPATKNSRKSPVRGQKMNVALYHSKRGRV